MPGEILEVTPIISDNRGEEIDQWLSGRAEGSINYIIIDDLPPKCFKSHQINKLIQINPLNGITTAVYGGWRNIKLLSSGECRRIRDLCISRVNSLVVYL